MVVLYPSKVIFIDVPKAKVPAGELLGARLVELRLLRAVPLKGP